MCVYVKSYKPTEVQISIQVHIPVRIELKNEDHKRLAWLELCNFILPCRSITTHNQLVQPIEVQKRKDLIVSFTTHRWRP